VEQAAESPSPTSQPPSPSPSAAPGPPESDMGAAAVPASGTKVLFVSHGPRDPGADAVLQFMQQLSLAVLEADHTNGLIETLEGRNDMAFVVVMNAESTGNDGKAMLSDNSMFKLGYCAGRIGMKRMCMMHSTSQHGNSNDGHGIPHLPVDANG